MRIPNGSDNSILGEVMKVINKSAREEYNYHLVSFLLVFTVINLHLLRNVSVIYYILLGGAIIAGWHTTVFRGRRIEFASIGYAYVFFLLTSMISVVHSFFTLENNYFVMGFIRYHFVVFLAVFAFKTFDNELNINRWMKYTLLLFLAFGLTLPYQHVFGVVSWFAEAGERAGLTRYGSLFGSLTVIGAVIPMLLLFLDYDSKYSALIVLIVLVISVLSLQKAAILGLSCAALLFYYESKKKIRLLLAFTAIIGAFTISLNEGLLEYIPGWDKSWNYFQTQVLYSEDSGKLGDVNIMSSLFDRSFGVLVTQTLSWLYMENDVWGYIYGGGYQMLGPALIPNMPLKYYTSHNGFVDLVLVGGVLHLIGFLALIYTVIRQANKSIASRHTSAKDKILLRKLRAVLFYLLLLNIFSGGVIFQPASGSVFWAVVGIIWSFEINENKNKVYEE